MRKSVNLVFLVLALQTDIDSNTIQVPLQIAGVPGGGMMSWMCSWTSLELADFVGYGRVSSGEYFICYVTFNGCYHQGCHCCHFTGLTAGALVEPELDRALWNIRKLLFLLLCIMLLKIPNVSQCFRSQFLVTTHFQYSRYEHTQSSGKNKH